MNGTDQEARAFLESLYATHFGEAPTRNGKSQSAMIFSSAPGRVELAGNHTDHQGGCTISAAVNRRAFALAAPNGTDTIRVFMEGFGEVSICVNDLGPHESEKGSSIALIRGMAAAYSQAGKTLRGLNMVTCSNIPVGRGLSSSAAFEVLIGASIRALNERPIPTQTQDLVELALEGVWAEQTFFGKPCGAQDQLASAIGGIVAIDFSNDNPCVTPIKIDMSSIPYTIFLIDSQCDHSRFTDEYAAVPADMFAVARFFNQARLGDVSYDIFLESFPHIRAQLGDRAALRALHYFEETQRVKMQMTALKNNDFESFLELARLSGASSAQYLQNVSPREDASGNDQSAMIILALCSHLLDGTTSQSDSIEKNLLRGAYRIHGGGFGGSVLAFVPSEHSKSFQASMNTLLGYNACASFSIGSPGVRVERFG